MLHAACILVSGNELMGEHMALEGIEPPEPKKTGHRWVDMIVALLALFMSVLSIFVAQHTSETMERLVHANSWPFLQMGSSNSNEEGEYELGFHVSNVGTGPARIHTFELLIDDQPVEIRSNVTYTMIENCCGEDFSAAIERAGGNPLAAVEMESTAPIARRFLAPNDTISALRWPRTENNATLWTAVDQARQRGRVGMRACYCSVFDECWIAQTNVFPPTPVASCEPGAPVRAESGGH